ncbi:hypothetical protein [Mucilaginibacter sp.]|uniref:hypothetical protein n=1 Tax=Mucilaginibacter sp. TaxID=1882438 RepID=UPI0026321122|nr:hypothetical protein [Mucilaginibacter sp.]
MRRGGDYCPIGTIHFALPALQDGSPAQPTRASSRTRYECGNLYTIGNQATVSRRDCHAIAYNDVIVSY